MCDNLIRPGVINAPVDPLRLGGRRERRERGRDAGAWMPVAGVAFMVAVMSVEMTGGVGGDEGCWN